MAHAGIIDIDKLNTALDETEKRKQHEAEMEKQLDEVVQKRDIIRMLGDLPLYHVGFGRLVKGANPEINEPLIKLSDLMNAVAELPTVNAEPVVRCKDCKHWLPHTQFGYDADYEEYHNYCNRHLPDDDFYAFIKEAEDYCSWAERKGKGK